MVQLSLPKNSKVGKGKAWPVEAGAKRLKTFKIYRYDPTDGENPYWVPIKLIWMIVGR